MKTNFAENKNLNVYQIVTNRIVEQIEKGLIPWRRPWTGVCAADGGAINYVTRKSYSFLNQMLLGRAGEWLTFKQIQDLKGSIKKGAKSGLVVFYTSTPRNTKKSVKNEETGEIETINVIKDIPVLKYYRVFHIDDCTGIESKIKIDAPAVEITPIDAAENVINDYVSREGLKFQNNKPSNRAYYAPALDQVVVPMMSQYDIIEEYYSTTFHELTHSTMKKSRCDRENDNKFAAFGSENYSREELVAEIGSAMLCRCTGIDNEKAFKNSVAYVQGWLRALKNDNKMIVWASSRAEKAAKYIQNITE